MNHYYVPTPEKKNNCSVLKKTKNDIKTELACLNFRAISKYCWID